MRDVKVDIPLTEGKVSRLVIYMTHYRKPMNWTQEKFDEARKALRRFILACEPTDAGPPQEIIDALSDDLNTPLAVTHLHTMRKQKRGHDLFASLRFMGFMEDVDLPAEITGQPAPLWEPPVVLKNE